MRDYKIAWLRHMHGGVRRYPQTNPVDPNFQDMHRQFETMNSVSERFGGLDVPYILQGPLLCVPSPQPTPEQVEQGKRQAYITASGTIRHLLPQRGVRDEMWGGWQQRAATFEPACHAEVASGRELVGYVGAFHLGGEDPYLADPYIDEVMQSDAPDRGAELMRRVETILSIPLNAHMHVVVDASQMTWAAHTIWRQIAMAWTQAAALGGLDFAPEGLHPHDESLGMALRPWRHKRTLVTFETLGGDIARYREYGVKRMDLMADAQHPDLPIYIAMPSANRPQDLPNTLRWMRRAIEHHPNCVPCIALDMLLARGIRDKDDLTRRLNATEP